MLTLKVLKWAYNIGYKHARVDLYHKVRQEVLAVDIKSVINRIDLANAIEDAFNPRKEAKHGE